MARRLTIDLTDAAEAEVERLAKEAGLSTADLFRHSLSQFLRLKKLEALESAVTKRHAMWAKETDEKYAGYRSVALTEFREIRGEQERQLKPT